MIVKDHVTTQEIINIYRRFAAD